MKLDGDPQHAGFQFRAHNDVATKTAAQTYFLHPDGKGEMGKERNWPQDKTLVDLPYPETATARAARERGARVVTGFEVLVAQGAASFELWTGVPAPVDVMRRAVGLST